MKIVGQNNDGRLVIDLEGEEFNITKLIPVDSPAVIINGVFNGGGLISNVGDTSKSKRLIGGCEFPSKDENQEDVDLIDDRFEILDL